MSINVVPARKNRDPPTKSGGIFVTAIFIPKYVLPQMTYTKAKHVMVMATGFEDGEFMRAVGKKVGFWRAIPQGLNFYTRKSS